MLVTFKAALDKAEEFAALLTDAVKLAADDDETRIWCALRYSQTEFGIFEVFADEAARDAHLAGTAAADMGQKMAAFLAEQPTAISVEVLAAK
jgi:quinol monooxygenase YgiN